MREEECVESDGGLASGSGRCGSLSKTCVVIAVHVYSNWSAYMYNCFAN